MISEALYVYVASESVFYNEIRFVAAPERGRLTYEGEGRTTLTRQTNLYLCEQKPRRPPRAEERGRVPGARARDRERT